MGITQTAGNEDITLEITPDHEYEYILAINIFDNANTCLRRQGDKVNLWDISKGKWHSEDFSYKETDKTMLYMTIITSKFIKTLPLLSQLKKRYIDE